MLAQIPILINRKGSKVDELAFQILPVDKKDKISHRRQKTYDSTEKPEYQQRKHDTLDPKKVKGQCRYRRISSSGAVNKFPRDFFKGDLPSTPIKIRFSRSKKQNASQSQSFTKIKFNECVANTNKKQKKEYKISSPEINEQKMPQVQTPKFNNKILNNQDQQCQLQQVKQKTTNKKMKLEQYLIHKKQKFPLFFVDQIQNNQKQKNQICQDSNKNIILVDKKQQIYDTSKINKNNQFFFETLNRKQNFIIDNPINNKKFILKKQLSIENKQNQIEIASARKPNQKNVKKFLSTKGLNWKMVQKLSSQRFKSKQRKVNKKQNLFGENRKMINTIIKKEIESKPTEFQENVFRIRKFT